MIVNADVRDVRGHQFKSFPTAKIEEGFVAGGVVLQQRRAELKTLSPLGPSARGVLALNREDRRALGRVPGLFDV